MDCPSFNVTQFNSLGFHPMQRPQSARSAGAEEDGHVRPWRAASARGRNFGDPPSPRLEVNKPNELPPALQTDKEPKVSDLAHFQIEDAVKILGESTQKWGPRRPRSANVMRVELADCNLRPYQQSALYREVCCLVRCDSTDTTCERGKPFWVKQNALEKRPFATGREFCTPGPRWSKKFGLCPPRLFDAIAQEQERLKLEAEIPRKPKPPMEAHFTRKKGREPPPTSPYNPVPPHRRRRQCPPSARVRVATTPRHREAPQRMNFAVEVDTHFVKPTMAPPQSEVPMSPRPTSARASKNVTLPPKA